MNRHLLLPLVLAGATALAGCGELRQAAATTTAPTTTISATTSSSSTIAATTSSSSTSTTTTLAWQRFPLTPPAPPTKRVIRRIETTDPVVFLTIDDDYTRDPRIPDLLAAHGATATLFIMPAAIRDDPAYFARFVALGGTVNSHTLHHEYMTELTEAEQRKEICRSAELISERLGSPAGPYFRPPYGEWDGATVRAAAACGMDRVVLWDISVNNGTIYMPSGTIHPGDILIFHFREDLYTDLEAVFAKLDELGLSVARLEDYLPDG